MTALMEKERCIVCTNCHDFITVIGPDRTVDKSLRRVDWETGPYLCRKCAKRSDDYRTYKALEHERI